MNSGSNIWSASPVVPVKFFLEDMRSTVIGVTSPLHRGELSPQVFTLQENGALVHAFARFQQRIVREEFIAMIGWQASFLRVRMHATHQPLTKMLIHTLYEQFSVVAHALRASWPATLEEARQIFVGERLGYTPWVVQWDKPPDRLYALPDQSQAISFVHAPNVNDVDRSRSWVRVSLKALEAYEYERDRDHVAQMRMTPRRLTAFRNAA